MRPATIPDTIKGLQIFLVGAKGTGMTALAEILVAKGAIVSGSDVDEVFYTDRILAAIGVKVGMGFDASALPTSCDLVIHSAAYSPEKNAQLVEAHRRMLPVLTYPEALGELSKKHDSSGIAGVHGKTTTTALAGSIALALGLPATIIAGSAVTGFGGRSTLIAGERFLIAETCEYRRHFLHFAPKRIVLTSIESDHQDYYPTYGDIYRAFQEYIDLLPKGGSLVYCADDEGARAAALEAGTRRPDLELRPYGEQATGPFRLFRYSSGSGTTKFELDGFEGQFKLRVPGKHVALDAVGAFALCASLCTSAGTSVSPALSPAQVDAARKAILNFSGTARRSEILGEAEGILFMDDYGHHPTAIRKTISGIRDFWPERRVVVDFMSHTYSRTKALLSEFAACLDAADEVIIHRIYSSAREAPDPEISGEILAEAIKSRANRARHGGRVRFFPEPLQALPTLMASLHSGDLFLTMGAGDNWRLGRSLIDAFGEEKRSS